jgi:hypothetical protein
MTSTASLAPKLTAPLPPDENRVDLIGIGVQKAASTWLHRCLIEHPSIRPAHVPPGVGQGFTSKELNFFNRYYERGYCWYHQWFDLGPWHSIDFSVLYFHDRNCPARVHAYNPRAKLLLALRNPVDRAFSHHRHEVRQGRLPADLHHFWDALAQNPSYLEQGFYAAHLERWLEYFDRASIHVVDFDDVRTRPAETLEDVLRFIGLDPAFRARSERRRVNDSLRARSPVINRMLSRSADFVRARFGDGALRVARGSGLPALLRRANTVDLDRRPVPELRPEDRARLVDIFGDDIDRLGRMIGRDLSHWR